MKLCIATFNIENLDGDSVDEAGAPRRPTLEEGVFVMSTDGVKTGKQFKKTLDSIKPEKNENN